PKPPVAFYFTAVSAVIDPSAAATTRMVPHIARGDTKPRARNSRDHAPLNHRLIDVSITFCMQEPQTLFILS
ncbi:MAG TPA: hypothetical protein PKX61_08635, partial [Syntrophales bacterium]|nr:hypothetical protein [Syntrophales bacterium]